MILSVVIPVYNVKTYLKHCLDTVVEAASRVAESEIICVDDGSTDGSSKILKEYEMKGFIRVLESQHINAGAARNRGLKEALGKYVYFCDGDDFMDPEMFEDLLRVAERDNAQVVCTGNRVLSNQTRKIIRTDRISECLRGNGIIVGCGVTVWNKLFRHDFLKKEGLLFEEVNRANDIRFVTLALLLAERLSFSDRTHYVYRQGRDGSLQTSRPGNNILSFADSLLQVHNILALRRPDGAWKEPLINAVLTHFRYQISVRADGSDARHLYEALCWKYYDDFEMKNFDARKSAVRAQDRDLFLSVEIFREECLKLKTTLDEREAKLKHVWHWHEHHRVEKEKARAKVADLLASREYRFGKWMLHPFESVRSVLCKLV